MNKRLVSFLLPICAITSLTACVRQEDVATLQARVAHQEQQQRQIQRQLSGVQPVQADTWAEVQSMRQELAHMRGQIDDMNTRLNALGTTQDIATLRSQIEMHDAALHRINEQFDLELQLVVPEPTTPTYPLPPTTTMPTGMHSPASSTSGMHSTLPQAIIPQGRMKLKPRYR